MADAPAIDAARVIADLRELERRTANERGAQRVCWGETWLAARELLGELLGELDLEAQPDPAANLWARLEGADPAAPALALGSHLDSVPDGGWLDGALGVMAALGLLRAWAEHGEPPPRPLLLVDWADEEGARFGRSLFGSSAFAMTLEPADLRELRDSEGRAMADVLAEHEVELDSLATRMLERDAPELGAYLELHIEQGPVLEGEGLPVAAVAGCAGVERRRLVFSGQAAHAGTTPMDARHDAGLAAAETALAVERVAAQHGGVGTTGELVMRPGIVTAVAGRAELLVDLRHPDAGELETMLGAAISAAREAAERRGCAVSDEMIWRIEPIPFDPRLVATATEIATAHGGRRDPLTSGALHDAAEVARATPTAMLFCPSRGGLSHAREEDTEESDLVAAIEAYGHLAARLLA